MQGGLRETGEHDPEYATALEACVQSFLGCKEEEFDAAMALEATGDE